MHVQEKGKSPIGIAVVILLAASSHLVWPQAADESGTIVMVARTANAVIVSVDSKIKPNDSSAPLPEIPATPISGDRKLVNVGEHSACALDGNLGANEDDRDLSASLRLWIAKNPETEAQEAIDALLDAAVGAWDRNNFTPAQIHNQKRGPGSRIAQITCGEFVNGHPVVVVGETYLKADGLSADKRRCPQDEKTVLYMGGVYDSKHFTTLINEHTFQPLTNDPKTNDGDSFVREDIQANRAAMSSLAFPRRDGDAK